jgi:hypothetical protein
MMAPLWFHSSKSPWAKIRWQKFLGMRRLCIWF